MRNERAKSRGWKCHDDT